MSERYALHYIGKRLYSTEKFEAEAARYGVSRSIPMSFLRGKRWGEPILLAHFEGRTDGVPRPDWRSLPKDGRAHVFGLFRIIGLNISGDELTKRVFNDSLHVERIEESSGTVDRECGTYTIGSVAYVRDQLYELIRYAENAERQTGGKLKLMATGSFRPIVPNVDLEPVKFTRTLLSVYVEGLDIESQSAMDRLEAEAQDGHAVRFLLDYKTRRYRKLGPEEKAAAVRSRISAANRGRAAKAERSAST